MARAAKKTSPWHLKGIHVVGCNCDWGCPCNFNARPTMGFCAGVWGWQIDDGKYVNVDLSGLNIAQAGKWPGAIHEGGGTIINFIDERASKSQRDALTKIMTGKAGMGGPYTIFASTCSRLEGPEFHKISIHSDSETPFLEIGSFAKTVCEPIRNPVTYEKSSIRIVHPTGGFIFNEGDVLNAVECRISHPPLVFTFPQKNGLLAPYHYKST